MINPIININTDPEATENADRVEKEEGLIIPKVPFIVLGIKVEEQFPQLLKYNHRYDYEFQFSSVDEIFAFLLKVSQIGTNGFDLAAYQMILTEITRHNL